jgi:DNA polymerase-3 subunit delta'
MPLGHQKIWQFLKKSAQIKKLSHAYLFTGQEKLGKKTLALDFIELLIGQDIKKKPHPDFVLIEPIAKEIQISQIRDLSQRLSLKTFAAPFKTAVIDQAHLMNQEAQTSLLKTLEEPKGNALLILITEMPERLFPTILSRCEIIKFHPVKKDEIKNYFKKEGISEKEAEEISEISLGRPGVAIDFISNPQKLESQKKLIKEAIALTDSDLASRFQYAKNLAAKSNLREILNIWLLYFRDVLLSKINPERTDKQQSTLGRYTPAKLKNILKLIQDTNFLISTTNVNPRLALEILMLEL